MNIRATKSISELMGVLYTRLFMSPQRKKSRGDKSVEIWVSKQRDNHAQSTCFDIPGPDIHEHTFYKRMALHPVETTCCAKHVRRYRYVVPEVSPAERQDTFKSLVKAVRCMDRVNYPP